MRLHEVHRIIQAKSMAAISHRDELIAELTFQTKKIKPCSTGPLIIAFQAIP
jgi:hypothetical protein